jgi:hypothetical protein
MTRFTDRHGREWGLTLTVGLVKTLRENGLDLNALLRSGEAMGDLLAADPEQLVAAMRHTVVPPPGRDEFEDGLDGDALHRAITALLEEAADFFPWSRTANLKARIRDVTRLMSGGSNAPATNSAVPVA